jgi:hypothetical protein
MKPQRALISLTLGALGTIGASTTIQAQEVNCRTAEFSPEVVARFPRIREACLEITTRKGEPYAVFKADVVRVRRDGVDVRFKLPDGSRSERRFIATRPDFRVLIEGTPTRVRDLAVGQELSAFVKLREPVVALAQADESVALEPAPLEASEPPLDTRVAEAMPQTASPVPLFALIGGALMALAAGMRQMRRKI